MTHRRTDTTKTRTVETAGPGSDTPRAQRSLSAIADRADNALRKASRRVLLGILAAVVAAVAISTAAFVVSVSTLRSQTAVEAAERVADRVEAGRQELASANTARALRGLPPFPSPAAGTNPDAWWLAAARAWTAVDSVDTSQVEGSPRSGVSTPAVPGEFRGTPR